MFAITSKVNFFFFDFGEVFTGGTSAGNRYQIIFEEKRLLPMGNFDVIILSPYNSFNNTKEEGETN